MAYCVDCGAEVPIGAKFCPSCGRPGTIQDAPATQPAPSAAAGSDSKRNTAIGCLVVVVVLAVIVGIIASMSGTDLDTGGDTAGDRAAEAGGDDPQETTPPPIEMSGTGKQASQKFALEGGVTVFRMTHQGGSNFSVSLLDGGSGDMTDLLANVIGNYKGSRVVGPSAGEYAFDIEADGSWTIKIEQPRATEGTVRSPATGSGPTAVGPVSLEGGLTTLSLNHAGSSNFAVWLINNDGEQVDLLANEIGSFEGSKNVGVSAGVYWLDVEADGSWNISF